MKNAGPPGLKEKSAVSETCQNTLHYISSKNIYLISQEETGSRTESVPLLMTFGKPRCTTGQHGQNWYWG